MNEIAPTVMEDRSLKRLRKKARKGMRGWPVATIAFYGPNLNQATKVAVGIVPFENAEIAEMRDWKVYDGDIRADADVVREILEFMKKHGVLSVAMTDGIIGCPYQEAVDYKGEWCPVCEFWRGRASSSAASPSELGCSAHSDPAPQRALRAVRQRRWLLVARADCTRSA